MQASADVMPDACRLVCSVTIIIYGIVSYSYKQLGYCKKYLLKHNIFVTVTL